MAGCFLFFFLICAFFETRPLGSSDRFFSWFVFPIHIYCVGRKRVDRDYIEEKSKVVQRTE